MQRPASPVVIVALVLAFAAGLGACSSGNGDRVSSNDSEASSSPTRPLSTTPPSTMSPPTVPPKLPTDAPKVVTVSGTLGDEAGRLVLLTDAGGWQLEGDLTGHAAGDVVVVRGTPVIAAETANEQPLTLRVMSIRPA